MAMRALQLVGRVAVGVVLGVVGVSLVGTRKILSQLCKGVCLLSNGGGWAGNESSALCKLVGGGVVVAKLTKWWE